MAIQQEIPKWISQFKVTGLFARKIGDGSYDELIARLQPGELLYALYDVLKTPEEIEAEKAANAQLPADAFGWDAPISRIKTVCMRVESLEEFNSRPWAVSGWVWFYAVPDWHARSSLQA